MNVCHWILDAVYILHLAECPVLHLLAKCPFRQESFRREYVDSMRLIHDEDLHGDDLIHAEDVYNRLEEIRPEIAEVIRIHEKYGSDDLMKYEKATKRDLMDIVY